MSSGTIGDQDEDATDETARERSIWDEVEEIPSQLRGPDLHVTPDSLRAHFASAIGRARTPIRNPHMERPLEEAERAAASPASVLIPVVDGEDGLAMLLTRRAPEISYGGHISFPGGRADADDPHPLATALREAHEEIDLPPSRVEVVGQLGDYTTKTGFALSTFVGLVEKGVALTPAPGEVAEIIELPLAVALRASSYRLARHRVMPGNAIYFLEHGDSIVSGPTISLLIGLYEALQKTHG